MNHITTKEAAALLGISTRMVCRLWHQGKLDGIKVNAHCLLIKKNTKLGIYLWR